MEQEYKSYQHANPEANVRKSSILRKKRIANLISATDLVLDVGAFNNLQLKYLKLNDNSQYYPVDINPFTPTTIVSDITKDTLPFEDNHFDKIIFSMVLEHLDKPLIALTELKRVLKEEGKLIIIVPNLENIVKIFNSIIYEKKYLTEEKKEHCIGFGTEEICALLRRISLKVVHFEKRNPEVVKFKLILPEWKLFKPFTSDILVVAKKN